MGRNKRCTWDDRKASVNLSVYGYDFADLEEVFDGRLLVTRLDDREDYGEPRFNALADLRGRIINITFTPRGDRVHLISARPASRKERTFYHEQAASR
jgi:uncharacterized DUF497 family protein